MNNEKILNGSLKLSLLAIVAAALHAESLHIYDIGLLGAMCISAGMMWTLWEKRNGS